MDLDQLRHRDELLSQRLALRVNGRLSHAFIWILARTGDSLFWLIIIAILYWQQKPLAGKLFLVVIATALLVAILKGIFRRQRPKRKWAIGVDKYSFPSGHAARAMAVALTLAFVQPPISYLWLLWALLVALARVAVARHYLSDVGGGIAVGMISGFGLELL